MTLWSSSPFLAEVQSRWRGYVILITEVGNISIILLIREAKIFGPLFMKIART